MAQRVLSDATLYLALRYHYKKSPRDPTGSKIEKIQRKFRVREWTPRNAPRIRTGATKKDQKAELQKNQTRRCYVKKPWFFSLIPLTTRQARDTKSPKWNSGDRRPTEQHSPSHRSGQRSGCARGGDSRPKHEKQPPSGASSHHAATEKREQRNDDHDETPRPARPPPRLFRR